MDENITPTPGKTHAEWLASVVALAGVAQAMLKDPLSGNPNERNEQATKSEDYYVKISDATSEAESWLHWHAAKEMGNISTDLTVARQDTELKLRMIPHRMLYAKLKAVAVSLKSRMKRAQFYS